MYIYSIVVFCASFSVGYTLAKKCQTKIKECNKLNTILKDNRVAYKDYNQRMILNEEINSLLNVNNKND